MTIDESQISNSITPPVDDVILRAPLITKEISNHYIITLITYQSGEISNDDGRSTFDDVTQLRSSSTNTNKANTNDDEVVPIT